MPQQLSCPNCWMVVTVPELSDEPRACPGCQTPMKPVAEADDEPIVAEPDAPPQLRLVELPADAPPPRPTVVVPHGPPPRFKARPVAEAWLAVATGLNMHRLAALIALVLLLAGLALGMVSWG